MYTFPQLLAHLVGDYLLQSDWMAVNKKKPGVLGWAALTTHAAWYTVPFGLLAESWQAMVAIGLSHALIDRYRLPQFLVWLKNQLSPPSEWLYWKDCRETGSNPDRPIWLTTWLLIIVDNTLHLLINGAILYYL